MMYAAPRQDQPSVDTRDVEADPAKLTDGSEIQPSRFLDRIIYVS